MCEKPPMKFIVNLLAIFSSISFCYAQSDNERGSLAVVIYHLTAVLNLSYAQMIGEMLQFNALAAEDDIDIIQIRLLR